MKKHGVLSALVMVVMICLSGVAQADLSDGLVAYYPFNGNANDESGNGNDGLEEGGINYTSGRAGKAANFDGVNDGIEIPDSSSLEFGNNPFTISAWIYPAEANSPPMSVFHHYIDSDCSPNTNERSIMMSIWDTETLYFYMCEGGSTCNSKSKVDSIIGAQEWQLITVYYDKSKVNIYHNSKLVSSSNYSGGISNPAVSWFIGSRPQICRDGESPSWFNGKIDDLRFYNRALSEGEIQELYNESDCTCPDSCFQAEFDYQRQAGRQECIDNPASCGIDIDGGYNEGYQAGRQKCIDEPASCGIQINAAMFDMFTNTLHIPNFQDAYWLDLGLNNWDPVTFELKNMGEISTK